MTGDLASVGGRQRSPARPGPGPIADELVRRLEIALTRRAGGRLTGDHRGRGFGEGLDLDRLRPYEPGDDVRRIETPRPEASSRRSARTSRIAS